MLLRIVSWNINSIRIRLTEIEKFMETHKPDILCLQEIKVVGERFPYEELKRIGFKYIVVRGEKSYNGVAILSKIPFEEMQHLSFVNEDTRHISIKIAGTDIELHNFYIPAGGDEPDVVINRKFKHKIEYIQSVSEWLVKEKNAQERLIIVGDLNVAPYENDVWSHKQLLNVVSHTPIEVENFNKMKSSIDLQDALRKFVPLEQKLFSWWSYRNHDWKRSNRGRRLDHILVTQPLYPTITHSFIYQEARDYSNPSDHVPVICDFKL
jgi:exodeoxyribonuclease-3